MKETELTKMTTDIVTALVANNEVSAGEVPDIIRNVAIALSEAENAASAAAQGRRDPQALRLAVPAEAPTPEAVAAEPQAPAPALDAPNNETAPKKEATPKKAEPLVPALPIKKSVTSEFIYCLEDGKPKKMMKRYLRSKYNMTPEQYRAKWGLPEDYPMTAPGYAAEKSSYAKHVGLGTSKLGRPATPASGKGSGKSSGKGKKKAQRPSAGA